LHNLRTLAGVNPERRLRTRAETRELYYPIFARLLEAAPAEHRARLAKAVAQMHDLAEEA
jgi:(p)ppGpp synthase/HD superfamily hydrolase